MKRLRRVEGDDLWRIGRALRTLREARDELKDVGARRSARSVARAIKSVEGAVRHAERCQFRQEPHVNGTVECPGCSDGGSEGR